MSLIILVAGLPAAGKTTFAKYLSRQMKIPMVSKDIIKEHLYDTIGFKNRAEKVALGIAATNIMYHFAQTQLEIGRSIILENNFETASKQGLEELIERFNCKSLTIMFYADIDVIYSRFIERDKSPERHKGHVVNTRYPATEGETLSFESQSLSLTQFYNAMIQRGIADFTIGGDRILVDTTDLSRLSYDMILREVREKLSLVPESNFRRDIRCYGEPDKT